MYIKPFFVYLDRATYNDLFGSSACARKLDIIFYALCRLARSASSSSTDIREGDVSSSCYIHW